MEDVAWLIATLRGERSYARISQDAGGTPSAPRIQQLASAPFKNAMDPPSVVGLARALDVTQRTLWLANGRSLGLDVGPAESPFLSLMPARTDRLSDAAVRYHLSGIRLSIAAGEYLEQIEALRAEVATRDARIAELEAATAGPGAKPTTARRRKPLPATGPGDHSP